MATIFILVLPFSGADHKALPRTRRDYITAR